MLLPSRAAGAAAAAAVAAVASASLQHASDPSSSRCSGSSGSSGSGRGRSPSAPRRSSRRRRRRRRRRRSCSSASSLFLAALLVALFASFFLASSPLPARAVTVIAASSLEACANDGKFDSSLNCARKLVVTLAVESGAALATTSLDFDVSCVNLPTNSSSSPSSSPAAAAASAAVTSCPCPCRHGADAGCACADLETPLRVSLTKTPSYATYPLTYVQPFNYAPREAVVRTGSGFSSLTCDAGALSSQPTCGWATTGSGALVTDRVPESQGFCCECSLDQLGSGTLGGGSTQATRGNLDCNLLSSLFIVPGSAHCLRHDSLWYEGYEMGTSLVDFEITVNATTTTSSSSSSSTSSPSSSSSQSLLLLTPSSPSGALPAAGVAARLLGDLSSYATPPDMGGSLLLIPHPSGASLTAILTANTSEWLVVDKAMASLDGRECDKVGTSFSAFRNSQPSACSQPAGSCLRNQIKDLRSADAQRLARGETPRYMIGRWGGGLPGARQAFRRGGTGPLWLGLPLPSTSASVVTLSVDASSLRVVMNVARGKVRSARVCAGAAGTVGATSSSRSFTNESSSLSSSSSSLSSPSPPPPPPPPPPLSPLPLTSASTTAATSTSSVAATCGSFQALAQKGVLTATIANEGRVAADFVVTATDCSSSSSSSSPSSTPLPVLPPPAVYLSLAPNATAQAAFDLHATSDFATNSDVKKNGGTVPNASCIVSVVDALGATSDSLVVRFAVNATEFEPPPTDGNGGGDGDGGGRPGVPRMTCSQRCPSWRDVLCRLRARCWREVLASTAVVAALAAGGIVLACGFFRGWWFRLCSCCLCSCQRQRRRHEHEESSSSWSRRRRQEQQRRRRQQQYSLPPPSPSSSPPTTPAWAQGSGAGLLSSPSASFPSTPGPFA